MPALTRCGAQVLVRSGTDYDARAETQILTDYLRAVWGHADPGQCEWLRAALPAV